MKNTLTNLCGLLCIVFLAVGLFFLLVEPATVKSTVKGLSWGISGIILIPVWIALSGRWSRHKGLKEERKQFNDEEIMEMEYNRSKYNAGIDPFYEQD